MRLDNEMERIRNDAELVKREVQSLYKKDDLLVSNEVVLAHTSYMIGQGT